MERMGLVRWKTCINVVIVVPCVGTAFVVDGCCKKRGPFNVNIFQWMLHCEQNSASAAYTVIFFYLL